MQNFSGFWKLKYKSDNKCIECMCKQFCREVQIKGGEEICEKTISRNQIFNPVVSFLQSGITTKTWHFLGKNV